MILLFNNSLRLPTRGGNGMQYGYDSHGNLTSITYEDGTHENFSYDAAGNVITATNRRRQTVTYGLQRGR